MPELPDVERARKLLHERCVGHKITRVCAIDDSIVFVGVGKADIEAQLLGRKVVGSGRRGKQFWLLLSGGLSLLMHFGMTGEVHIQGETLSHYRKIEVDVGETWPPQYTKLELEFDKMRVAYTDPRRLGRIRTFAGDASESPMVAKLGFDPVLDPPSPEDFARAVMRRKTPIKALLLNQEFSAGVGNWIADEVLFQSQIHPAHFANALSREQTDLILNQLKRVCVTAVEVNAESKLFPKTWLFHYRWAKGRGHTAQLPDGRKIEFVTVGGRTSAFVPEVQMLTPPPKTEDAPENRPKRRRK
ncbi:hypothetical protein GGH12_001138 [Coemansia sp. RSA 1822]|nr:hypothetical protein LPJ76_003618 [Coemansia sp. RSA 638]KAJ2125480.1 hypothetical protein IW147_000829 [Coemansia sp. RSA 720]KAJ2476072.1 hypothetical protein IWW56_005114 [Coemansia sp. RSA 2131]KAJ2542794.1 hypothetical protein GGF49_002594 [Coemansia sp. RSA 1853]KAJ2565896.1 hypothetical protein GGH12_001138 [Coemansia sp. RSA 1822]